MGVFRPHPINARPRHHRRRPGRQHPKSATRGVHRGFGRDDEGDCNGQVSARGLNLRSQRAALGVCRPLANPNSRHAGAGRWRGNYLGHHQIDGPRDYSSARANQGSAASTAVMRELERRRVAREGYAFYAMLEAAMTSASACSCAMSAGSMTTLRSPLGAVPVASARQDAAIVFVRLRRGICERR